MSSEPAFQPLLAPVRALYPPRARATNVSLIKNLRAAGNHTAFERADAEAAESMHPSLLAELDWMEVAMPEAHREGGRRLVDGFFVHHLPRILALRRAELDRPDDELACEVGENVDFYRNVLDDDRQPLRAVGEDILARIAAAIAQAPVVAEASLVRRLEVLRPAVDRLFQDVADLDWVPLLIERELRNALAFALDRPSSRARAKAWLRQGGGRLPSFGGPTASADTRVAEMSALLATLERSAAAARLFDIAALCRALADRLADSRESDFHRFDGELAMGYGHCASCAMMYASSAILSFDPTCPRVFTGDEGRIHIPLDFNVSVCPFCGEESRADAPSLFYSPQRHQAVYNFPRLGQFSEEEARQVHRPALTALRERLIARLPAADVAHLESAREEITYSIGEFLLAVQLGTTVREEHVYNLVRLFDGRGLLVDPTKGVMLELTRAEMAARWASALRPPEPSAAEAETGAPADTPGPAEALRAFTRGDTARARDILVPIFARHPGDEVTRKNLAAALLTLGDRETARRVLRGDTTWI